MLQCYNYWPEKLDGALVLNIASSTWRQQEKLKLSSCVSRSGVVRFAPAHWHARTHRHTHTHPQTHEHAHINALEQYINAVFIILLLFSCTDPNFTQPEQIHTSTWPRWFLVLNSVIRKIQGFSHGSHLILASFEGKIIVQIIYLFKYLFSSLCHILPNKRSNGKNHLRRITPMKSVVLVGSI